MNWWAVLWAFLVLQALWTIFVAATVRSLTEIKKTSWHHGLYKMVYLHYPKSNCEYCWKLTAEPFFMFVLSVLIVACYVVAMSMRTMTVFVGAVLIGRYPNISVKEFFTFEHGLFMEYATWSGVKIPFFVYYIYLAIVLSSGWLFWRVVSGQAATVEIISLVVVTASLAVFTFVFLKRKKLKDAYDYMKQNYCRKLPPVD